ALYPYVQASADPVPAARQSETWVSHIRDDLMPYWTSDIAMGSPVGNFPTNRGMDGRVAGDSRRYLRMLSRQTYAYSIGYLVTGDPQLLTLADAGARWILDHGWDEANGGWYQQLRSTGTPVPNGPKYAQDTAYAVLGLAAYYFITRDPASEEAILRTRDLLFDPERFFDEETGRIVDGMNAELSAEIEHADAGWELVAQLDPINAFMLLVQPVMSDSSRRSQFLADLRQLSEVMWTEFFSDGIFWGIAQNQGRYRTRHVDFGHNLKAYWMIREVDKRLSDAPFFDRLAENIDAQVLRAFDDTEGRWAKRPINAEQVEYGSDWWIYAESDQLAATLSLSNTSYNPILAQTQAAWLEDYVDDQYGEVFPNIRRNGAAAFSWGPADTAKCNLWKSGYHSMEHAVMMYLVGTYLEEKNAVMHFAVPASATDTFVARPYFLRGTEVSRTAADAAVTVGTRELVPVSVEFNQIH
ncbi:MAG: AGE family epimerase/isomerase, partial [Myxococcota bacterium]